MKNLLPAILLIFLSNSFLFSQTPHFYQYTSSAGLSSSTIYDVIQDSKGFIWFATANGISKFDGHKFKNFGVTDGLNSALIVSLMELPGNEIYIASYEKGINICKNDSIKNYNYVSPFPIKINFLYSRFNKLCAYYAGVIYSFENDSLKEEADFPGGRNKDGTVLICNSLITLPDGSSIASSKGLFKETGSTFEKLNIDGTSENEFYFINKGYGDELLACSNDKIFEIENFKIKNIYSTGIYKGKVNRAFKDSEGNLWFSIVNKGVYVIFKGSQQISDIGKKMGLQKSTITKIFQDNEGNIWLSTLGKGAFCFNNLCIKNYNEEDGISNMSVHRMDLDQNGNLLLGTSNGLNIFNGDDFFHMRIDEDVNMTPYIYSVKAFGNKIYVGYSFKKDLFVKKLYNGDEYLFYTGTSFHLASDSVYYFGLWGNQVYESRKLLDSVKSGHLTYAMNLGNVVNRINYIYEDSEKNIWFATTLGLCMRKNGTTIQFSDNDVVKSSLNFIKEDNKNIVWFAGEKGICGYDLKTKSFTGLKSYPGIDFVTSTSVEFDSKNRMWIGNLKGLYILEDTVCRHLTSWQGLPSNEVLSLQYQKNKNIMWAGTSNGLSSLDVTDFDNNKLPELKIETENISAGGHVYTSSDNLKFEPENNNVLINFRVINFSSPAALSYEYKIGDEWIEAESQSLDFRAMKQGNYSVSFRAKIPNGEWSKPGIISFTIKPKFTETIWFPVSIFGCFAIAVLFAARYRINRNKKQNIEKTEVSKRISELKLHALSATMNPHFIFNSLNSVQYLVNKGKKLEANEYISIMARLIRKNLDTANDSFILLSEEIEKLNLYLDVEQLRFQEKFTYEINVDTNLKTEKVLIPNMIVQPFVENAVWHGIMNIDKKGFVKISFEIEDVNINSKNYKCLMIKISDNGIGMKKSEEFKKDGHISHGIKIIQERLRLLSRELELPQPIVFEDLSLRNELSTGTEVIISLPDTLYKYTS